MLIAGALLAAAALAACGGEGDPGEVQVVIHGADYIASPGTRWTSSTSACTVSGMTDDGRTYIWEYEVRPGAEDAFIDLYNEKGSWVQLFRRSPGYIRTELYRDRDRPSRFVTVDHWESEDAFRAFRRRFAREFEDLDRTGERLTVREVSLGRFGPA